ncbi:MAG: S9 family peptidase [Ilumatobacteraceae bacterium]
MPYRSRVVDVTAELCIAGRDVTEPRLDPSGRRLAFVSRGSGAAAIQLVELDDPSPLERQLTTMPAPAPGRGMYGGCYDWLPDGSAIVYCAVEGALWRQPVPGGAALRLTDGDADRAIAAPAVAPDGTFVAYVVDTAEVWLQPLDGGPCRRLDDGGHDFCADPTVDPTSSAVTYQAWSVPAMPWDGAELATVGVDGTGRSSFRPAGAAAQQPRYLPGGALACVDDGSGWLQVTVGDQPLIAGGDACEHADASWGQGQSTFSLSPDGCSVAVARNDAGFGRLSVVDVAAGSGGDIGRGVHGQLSWRGGRLAALRSGARTPTEVVVYDTATWERTVVAVGPVAGWDAVELVEPEALTLDHDGITLHARRYRPPGERAGRLLVMLHGGPTGQWPASFLPRVAYWVGQGWDVLLPDHRGSTGHGRAYQQALNGRWGELDVADTVAWVRHAVDEGWAESSSVAMTGGSSGGYTVLGVLGRHPGLVAAGVAAYPVTDLVDLHERSHRFEAHSVLTLIGPLADTERYRARSAMAFIERIVDPLLVLHGTADPVVPVEGTITFVDALRAVGGDVELHLFDGEGHGFRQPENQLAEYRLVTEFLERHVPRHAGRRR